MQTLTTQQIKANPCLPKKIQLAKKFFSFRPKPKINSKFRPKLWILHSLFFFFRFMGHVVEHLGVSVNSISD